VALGSAPPWPAAHGLRAHNDLYPLIGGNAAKAFSAVAASTVSFLFLRLSVFSRKEAQAQEGEGRSGGRPARAVSGCRAYSRRGRGTERSTKGRRARRCPVGTPRGTGGFRSVADRYDGYTVVDADGEKIGTVDTTYVNEGTQSEYVAVKRGWQASYRARDPASSRWISAP